MKDIFIAFRLLIVMTVICGGIYPLIVTGIAEVAFADKAHGSIVVNAKGVPVGSLLLAQKFHDAKYFWPRPSAADYATVASGASNKGPTSADLKKSVDERRAALKDTAGHAAIPAELLFASASGLDPHLSREGARLQVTRLATARKFDGSKTALLYALIERIMEAPQWGIWGEPRVNVLRLNLALDQL
jgi:potassium-transporting ATPase KdpC subunit